MLAGSVAGATPSAAQADGWGGPQSAAPAAPVITVTPAPASPDTAPPAAGSPNTATVVPVETAVPAAGAKKTSTEVLPWANKPLAPIADAPAGGDQAATQAAAAQCAGLFEAACRDLKTCAWVADIARQDGTTVPARCVARPPAPPKAAKAQGATKPKKTTAAPQAPAVKSAVTRVEETGAAAKPAQKTAAPPKVEAKPPPVAAAAPKEAAPKKAEEKPKEAAQAPIVVKPPQPPSQSPMPSFGSVSPVMPGGGDAVVVTVPPSGS